MSHHRPPSETDAAFIFVGMLLAVDAAFVAIAALPA
jgi:hypothetical protein